MARSVTCVVVGFVLTFSLSGCKDKTTTKETTTNSPSTSGTTKKTSPSTTKSTTKTTTTTNNIPSQTLSGDKTARYLNDIYYGKGKDSETAVYITYQSSWYFPCGTPCYEGKPDCYMAYAAYNNKMSLKTDGQKKHFSPYSGRQNGWILNATRFEKRYGKCAYVFDGTTENRVYGGCGVAAGSNGPGSCDKSDNAFRNMCGQEKCTSTSDKVEKAYCKNEDKGTWPKKKTDPPCFWKLPAFDNHSNELQEWYQQRLDVQTSSDNLAEWNEIAVDLSVVKKDMMEDASKVIVAFVYNDVSGKEVVTKFRNQMQQTWRFQPGNNIPLIKIDWTANVEANEDVFKSEEGESLVV